MASDRGAPSIGLCSKCGQKCAEFWTASPCKHEACRKCLETAGNTATCFGCRKTVAFLVCPGSRHGCKFDTRKGSWKDHLSKCFFRPLECPNRCGMAVLRKQLLSHLATDCQLRLTECQFCEETVFEVEVRDHENSCPKAPVSCPYCLREGLLREEMAQHAEGCSKTPKPCPLREYGCDFSGMDEDIDRHLTVRNHVACFHEMKRSQQEHKLEIEKLWSKLNVCSSELDSCKNYLAELSNGGGAIPFDREIQWLFQPPIPSSGCLFSPLYRHRGSGAVVYFRLSFSQKTAAGNLKTHRDGEGVHVALYQHNMQAGRANHVNTFTLAIYMVEYIDNTGNFGSRRRRSKVGRQTERQAAVVKTEMETAKKVPMPTGNEKMLETELVTGKQCMMTYEQED